MPGSSSARTPSTPASHATGSPLDAAASTATFPAESQVDDTTASAAGRPSRALPLTWWRGHTVFGVVLLVGLGLRILAQLAFRPALIVGESGSHLVFLSTWTPSTAHPVGYGILELAPLSLFTDALAPVVAVQHLMGLTTGVVVYVLLLRWGVWRWLAAVATVPVVWDAYQLAGEHLVLPDTLFVLLVALALLVFGWTARPSATAALGGAILLGAATTVRLAGAPLVLAAVLLMLMVGRSWRDRLAGALIVMVGFAIPVAPYVAWYHHAHGEYAVAQHQTRRDDDANTWRFAGYVPPETWPRGARLYAQHGSDQLEAARPAADALVSYQKHGVIPDSFLLGGLLLGLLAGAGLGRAGPSGMRAVCLLVAVVPAVVALGVGSAGELSWRNHLPGLVLGPTAGALGLTALLRGRRAPSAGLPQIDDTDRAALAAFRETYANPTFAPVVVVIAAYNEATGLPRVLTGMPSTVCGLAADVVVVDDGSTDATVAAARAHDGAYLVVSGRNRGQGAAMRLGYRVARDHGARYIITTDADAQYDTADFPTVLAPILDGTADFVTGSRRLGHQHTVDRFRRAGVHVFGWLVSALTGERLTDTSFGLRAMRAEVTAAVTLNQPQYQSSELLIGAHSHGFRVAEVPGTMHLRAAGSTKKGGNLVYGTRYARVVLGTFWREGCPTPAKERAPALLGCPDSVSVQDNPGR